MNSHSARIRQQISQREAEETARLTAEYAGFAAKLAEQQKELKASHKAVAAASGKTTKDKAEAALAKLQAQADKTQAKLDERDEKIAEAQRRAESDRQDVDAVGVELVKLYADPDELLKHARLVGLDEVTENEHNLNIPRYVDTFEPEKRVPVMEALMALADAEGNAAQAQFALANLLKKAGYAT